MVEKASFFFAIFTILFILLFPNVIYAGQDTWTGDSSDNWNEPGNWQSSKVPDSTDSVTIPSKLKNYPDISGNAYCMRIRILGTCKMKAGAMLNITGGGEVIVETGGTFQATGDTSGYATVTRYGGCGSYKFEVKSSGTIGANTTIFEYMDSNGVELESGAKIDTMLAFKNCIFKHGAEEGVLFTINADLSGASDTFIIEDCRFDSLSSESLNNNVYRDSTSIGYIYFVSDSGGSFWGENYDDDEGDLMVWNLKPVAFIGFPNDSDCFKTYSFIPFSGDSSYDQDGSIVSYIWSFGDSSSDTGSFVYHSYEDTGKYTVGLTVKDNFSSTSTIYITLMIKYIRLGGMTFTKITDLEMDGEQEVIVIKNHSSSLDTSYLEIHVKAEEEILMSYNYDSLLCRYTLLGGTEWPAAIGDLDLDDTLDIVVATNSNLYCLRWHRSSCTLTNMPGSWPREYERTDMDPFTPIISDFDYHNGGDKNPEILFIPTKNDVHSPFYRLFILEQDGDTLFYRVDNILKGPASIADFNMDNIKEILVISNIDSIYMFSCSLDVISSLNAPTAIDEALQVAPSIGDIDFSSDSNLIELEFIIPKDGKNYTAYEIDPTTLTLSEKWESIIDTTDTSGAFCSPALGRDYDASGKQYYDLWGFAGRTGSFIRLEPDSGLVSRASIPRIGRITQPSIGNMDSDLTIEVFYGLSIIFSTTDIILRSFDFDLNYESYSCTRPTGYQGIFSTPAIGNWDDDSNIDLHFPFVHVSSSPYDSLMNDAVGTPYNNYNIDWGQAYHDERNTSLYAQPVGGTLSTNAVWWGTYIIYKDFKIAQNCTLYIEPGTKIWVLPDSLDGEEIAILSDNLGDDSGLVDIVVEGTIEAHGKEHAPIVFTSLTPDPTYCDWGGIEFKVNGGKGYLEYTLIENADKGIHIKEYDVDLEISNCEIRNCKLYGIMSEKTRVSYTVTIDSTYIHTVDTIFPPNGGNAIRLENSSNVEITNCTFENIWMYSVYLDSTTDVVISSNYINREFIPSITAVVFNYNSSPSSDGDGEFSYNYIKAKQCIKTYNSSSPRIEHCLLENPWDSDASYLVWVASSDCEPVLRSDTLKGYYYIGVYTPTAKIDLGEFEGDENVPENCCLTDEDTLDDNGDNYFHYAYSDTDSVAYYVYVDVDSPACNGPSDPTARIPAEGNYWCEDYMPIPDSLYLVTSTVDIGTPAPGGDDGRGSSPACCPPGGPKIVMIKADILPTFEVNLYPSPFNENLGIYVSIPYDTDIKVGIYNILGNFIREIINKELEAGKYKLTWDGKNVQGKELPSGVYFIKINMGEKRIIKKTLLLK